MVYQNTISSLSVYRRQFKPLLPPILQNLNQAVSYFQQEEGQIGDLKTLFPHSLNLPIVHFRQNFKESPPLKVGAVFSGGPASGGHNVISGLFDALKKLNPASQLIGFLNGPDGIIKNKTMELTEEQIDSYRNQGGFDGLGTGRTKIETPEQYQSVEKTLLAHQLDGLVIIGGDDSNTNAAFLAEFCLRKGIQTRIVGVPKTIDGDLKNSFIEASFGFDTASKTYSETIGNFLKDALSQKKYYFFIKLMGRSASHLTLECALKTQVNLALIAEEIAAKKEPLKNIVKQIADLICARSALKKNYGVILIPEGLLDQVSDCREMIKEINQILRLDLEQIQKKLSPASRDCFSLFPETIKKQLLLDRDPHGNIQFSKIETERLLIALVDGELKRRKDYSGHFSPQPEFCGYEGRCALPSNFDCNYCYSLGHLAALLIRDKATGYMCSIRNLAAPVENWEVSGIPIVKMLHFEKRNLAHQAVLKKSLVDLDGPVFARFKQERKKWELDDHYLCPGPIQFDGPKDLSDMITITLSLEWGSR